MATNLTASQITKWKNTVDGAVLNNLVSSLKRVNDCALNLKRVTASSSVDDNANLSYRFNDLAKVSSEAAKQLTTFMKSFDSSLTSYISTVKKAEATAAENVRKQIDQFAEAASKISKLKM